MKNIICAILVVMFISVVSCNTPGATTQELNGKEESLPDELKGLKVYTVATGKLGGMQIAVLKDQVIGTQYKTGKTSQSVGIIRGGIPKEAIIYENDSIIILRK